MNVTQAIAWLRQQGGAAIDYATSPVSGLISHFNKEADLLEQAYRRVYYARLPFVNAGKSFPYESQFQAASSQVITNRGYKLDLLKAMHIVNANPADYGLSIYGLTQSQIEDAYPGLKYDAKYATLGYIQFVIGAVVLVAIAAAVVATMKLRKEMQALDLTKILQAQYVAQGMAPDVAAQKAAADVKAAADAAGGPGFLDSLSSGVKILGGGLIGYVLGKALKLF